MRGDKYSLTRRRLLQTGALVSLTGFAGIAGATENGNGGGGRAFITTTATELLNESFTISNEVDSGTWNPTQISPSCQGNSKPQEHVPYDTDLGSWIFFPADRNVNTGNEYEIASYTEDCGDVGDGRDWIKVVTKPA